ncbi:MAG: DUF2911 domain-containing protein [Acidobacteriaceae bacterium]
MKQHRFSLALLTAALLAMVCLPQAQAQMSSGAKEAPLSPPEKTSVTLEGKTITIDYSAPSMRGRKIMGGLVPYGQVWRTGANAATSFTTEANLKIGDLTVPVGKYTLYTLPSEGTWKLIINKQTGQWGLTYNQAQDLGRVDMRRRALQPAQERFNISFVNTREKSTELHLKWENTDVFVPVAVE